MGIAKRMKLNTEKLIQQLEQTKVLVGYYCSEIHKFTIGVSSRTEENNNRCGSVCTSNGGRRQMP